MIDENFTNMKANLIYGINSVSLLRNDDNFNQDLVVISNKFPDEEIILVPMKESTTIKFLEFLKLPQNQVKAIVDMGFDTVSHRHLH